MGRLRMSVHSRLTETPASQTCSPSKLRMSVHSRLTETLSRSGVGVHALRMGVYSRLTEVADDERLRCVLYFSRFFWADLCGG
jgi:hypothetical protein